jgi:hypothetical protein
MTTTTTTTITITTTTILGQSHLCWALLFFLPSFHIRRRFWAA